MKKILILVLGVFFILNIRLPLHAHMAKPVIELIELLGKAEKRTLSATASKSLEHAFQKYGTSALDVTHHSGSALAEAAARYGDDIYDFAVRVPHAAPVLAARPQQL